jgi:hypothetical protein
MLPKPHSFCVTPEEKCTMNYCDENGCQNRKRELVEPKPNTTMQSDLSKKVKEDICIAINYGKNAPLIKTQLTLQGFKFNKQLIKGCEEIRLDLLSLINVEILTKKQGQKAFQKLNTIISNNVIETTFGDVKSKLKKTFINNKEVK